MLNQVLVYFSDSVSIMPVIDIAGLNQNGKLYKNRNILRFAKCKNPYEFGPKMQKFIRQCECFSERSQHFPLFA
jgi:hypothetical protein